MKKKKWKIIGAITGLILLVAGIYVYSEFNRKVKDLSRVQAGVRLDAGKLVSVFEKSEEEGNRVYLDQVLAVSGTIRKVEQEGSGSVTVVLADQNSNASVRCSMDADHVDDVSRLETGAMVTMKGACAGFLKDELLGSDVILNRCVLEK